MLEDENLFQRVQAANQRQVVDKLLHDLRNPVHSLRITIELFSRLAMRTGQFETLLERAARYVAPAETAMNALIATTERLSVYLSPPAAPALRTLRVDELLTELAILLRGSGRELEIDLADVDVSMQFETDRPRLGHALLRHCLSNVVGQIRLSARASSDEIWIDVSTGSPVGGSQNGPAFTTDELRVLIENAGGSLTAADQRISAGFKRSAVSQPSGQ